MDARNFLVMMKREAIDYPLKRILEALQAPKSPIPINTSASEVTRSIQTFMNAHALDEQRKANWFRDLDDNGREILKELLQECAELSVDTFLAVLDGVGGPYEGTFELIAIDAEENRTVVNPENGQMLHDIFAEVLAESRNGQ